MKASEIFKVGNHKIGYVDSDFLKYYGDEEVDETLPVPEFKKLGETLSDDQIDAKFAPSKSSPGHVLAFIENPPEGTKDGWSNIFYVENFVVGVRWGDSGWGVRVWLRDVGWYSGFRVFSPAFGSAALSTGPSVSLSLRACIEKVEKELAEIKKLIG